MIPIDEQIVAIRNFEGPIAKAVVASLERLKRIYEVQVPDEPVLSGCDFNACQEYSDTMRDMLRRVTAERDACAQTNDDQSRRVFAAEAELAETKRLLAEPVAWEYFEQVADDVDAPSILTHQPPDRVLDVRRYTHRPLYGPEVADGKIKPVALLPCCGYDNAPTKIFAIEAAAITRAAEGK